MKNHANHFIRSFIDWLFRRRHPSVYLLNGGIAFLLLLFTGWAISILIPTQYGSFSIRFDSESGTPTPISYGLFLIASCLIIFAFIWYRTDQKRISRKKVIVVEARGLRDSGGTPLHEALPEKLEGHRDTVPLDLRQNVKDGVIIDPGAALDKLISLPFNLKLRESDHDRSDITYVYGGLAPVPFTFLTGVLMDDEGPIVVMDWDRHAAKWRALDSDDDGKRFTVNGLNVVQTCPTEIALAVSVSYRVDLFGVRRKVVNMPVVEMVLASGSPDCHWSENKQKALGQQFLDLVITLGNRGVKHIHLFLAAQNSVVFRFGRLYDKRNLPELIAYQYQREETPPYPWGIRMPVSGVEKPELIQ